MYPAQVVARKATRPARTKSTSIVSGCSSGISLPKQTRVRVSTRCGKDLESLVGYQSMVRMWSGWPSLPSTMMDVHAAKAS